MAGIGALANIGKDIPQEAMQQVSMADMGYPSNLKEEDKK